MVKNNQGFTMIEILMVVAILSLLAAIAIPQFLRFHAKSKRSEAVINLKAIQMAQTAYFASEDTYAATSMAIDETSESQTLEIRQRLGLEPMYQGKVYRFYFHFPARNADGNQVDYAAYANGVIDGDGLVPTDLFIVRTENWFGLFGAGCPANQISLTWDDLLERMFIC